MSTPETLSRPLAGRVKRLSEPDAPADATPALPQRVIDAAIDALNRGETHYTNRPGIAPLRQAITDYLQARFAIDIPPDAITITAGATEARFAVIRTLAQTDTQVVCPGGAANIAGAVHLANAKLTDTATDPAAVFMVYLTPDVPQDVTADLLLAAAESNWWIIWDISAAEKHSVFHPGQQAALVPRVITIGGLDMEMPGWRVGWMAGSEVAGKLRAFKQSMTICTTNVSQWAALALMEAE